MRLQAWRQHVAAVLVGLAPARPRFATGLPFAAVPHSVSADRRFRSAWKANRSGAVPTSGQPRVFRGRAPGHSGVETIRTPSIFPLGPRGVLRLAKGASGRLTASVDCVLLARPAAPATPPFPARAGHHVQLRWHAKNRRPPKNQREPETSASRSSRASNEREGWGEVPLRRADYRRARCAAGARKWPMRRRWGKSAVIDRILPDAFALTARSERGAALGMRHFDVQLIGRPWGCTRA